MIDLRLLWVPPPPSPETKQEAARKISKCYFEKEIILEKHTGEEVAARWSIQVKKEEEHKTPHYIPISVQTGDAFREDLCFVSKRGRPLECYYCKGVGHLPVDCKKKTERKRTGKETSGQKRLNEQNKGNITNRSFADMVKTNANRTREAITVERINDQNKGNISSRSFADMIKTNANRTREAITVERINDQNKGNISSRSFADMVKTNANRTREAITVERLNEQNKGNITNRSFADMVKTNANRTREAITVERLNEQNKGNITNRSFADMVKTNANRTREAITVETPKIGKNNSKQTNRERSQKQDEIYRDRRNDEKRGPTVREREQKQRRRCKQDQRGKRYTRH